MKNKKTLNKKISTEISIGIILMVVILISGIFYFKSKEDTSVSFQNQAQQNYQINKPVKEQQAKQEPANLDNNQNNLDINNVDNWVTFSNTNSGYILKYPQGYTIQKYDLPCKSKLNNETGTNVVIKLSDAINDNGNLENYIQKGQIIDFDIFENDPNDKCIINAYSSIGGPQAQMPKLISSENLIINGKSVFKRDYVHLNPDGTSSKFNFSTWRFKVDTKYYTLTFNNGIRIMNPQEQNDLFSKFLENFRIVK